MRRLLLLVLAGSALAQSPDISQKLREAQQAFGAGDCGRAQATLREVLAADPKNFVAHLLTGHCLLRGKDYGAAAGEFRRALEIRADAQPALSGLIQAYALSGDRAQRDAEIEHVRALINAGKLPTTLRFVREQFAAGDRTVTANEYPYVSLLRSRYVFEVAGAQQLELIFRESGTAAFSLVSGEKTLRVYPRGEPAYEQVVADVKAALAGKTLSAGDYTLAATPAVVEPFPITADDPSDARLRQLTIEYIAHSCFRIHTARGSRILIDPFASRVWLGYAFPARLAADAVLITHPHYDHDADVLLGGQPPPWAPRRPRAARPGRLHARGCNDHRHSRETRRSVGERVRANQHHLAARAGRLENRAPR